MPSYFYSTRWTLWVMGSWFHCLLKIFFGVRNFLRLSLGGGAAFDRQIWHFSRAFERLLSPGGGEGAEIWTGQSSKVQMPGWLPRGGGDVEVSKDRRITYHNFFSRISKMLHCRGWSFPEAFQKSSKVDRMSSIITFHKLQWPEMRWQASHSNIIFVRFILKLWMDAW